MRARWHSPLLLLALAVVFWALPALAVEEPATGESCMVVSAHPAATEVGLEILRLGGNAIDSAVATAFALAVCEPYSSGLGGGGFVMVFDAAKGSVRALDARETAPATASRDMYLIDGQPDSDRSCYGPLAVGVPGLVRGLAELHASGGVLPWPVLIEPARRLADEGIVVSPMLQSRIKESSPYFNAAALEIFLPGGGLPLVGETLIQADLASTLKAIASEGAGVFYSGPIARSLVATASTGGSGLSLEDLASYQCSWREPIVGQYRGLQVYSMPPPSSGGVHLIQMLNILENYDLTGPGYGSAAVYHLLAEAMKFAYADRSLYLGDSDFVPVPVARLVSRSHADSLRHLISKERAFPEAQIQGAPLAPMESHETTHLSIVDGQGNAVAATLTINLSFGSGLVAPGTGVILNDEMDDFVAAPGQPNAFGLIGGDANSIAPGKRPLSSMTPTILLQGGRVRMVSGAPGGAKIITTTLQTIVNVVDFQMNALQAVSAPRIHHQWYPAKLYFEHFGLSPDTAGLLRAWGHTLAARAPMCNAQMIVVDPDSGTRHGASDPRGMGTAAGF